VGASEHLEKAIKNAYITITVNKAARRKVSRVNERMIWTYDLDIETSTFRTLSVNSRWKHPSLVPLTIFQESVEHK
jgi:hypothetical protein